MPLSINRKYFMLTGLLISKLISKESLLPGFRYRIDLSPSVALLAIRTVYAAP
jgi:hypothetical protein